jgi:ornithine cyclodeaminase
VLARPDSTVLAIIGAGHQADQHIAAMMEAGQFEDIRISARTRESAERLAADWPLARAVDSHGEADPDALAASVDQQMEDAEGGIEASLLDAPDTATDTDPPT